MARPPARHRRPRKTPDPAAPAPKRSHAGKIVAAAIGATAAVGVGVGLHNTAPSPQSVAACGGTERWNVKVGNDADAVNVDLNAKAGDIASLNRQLPGPVDAGGRMQIETSQFTIKGYLAFFKHETDDDYHLVITDDPSGKYAAGKSTPTGHSIVVEIPDPSCFAGHGGSGPSTSRFAQAISDVRTEFEAKTAGINGAKLTKPIPVTVTGIAFFDFDHGQTGHATPHPGVDGQSKVIELHPLTQISFDNAPGD